METFNYFSVPGPGFAVARLRTYWVNLQRFAVTVDILTVKRGNIEKASWGGLGVLCPGAPAAGCAGALQGTGYGDRDLVRLSRA